jgi:arsenite methyltransferase
MDDAQIKDLVRARYGGIAAAADASCCPPAASSCCGPETASHDKARRMGYSDAELAAVPEGANLGLGCGNPQAIAALKPGEVVIDLGSGAGFDCFLAARQVGFSGYVIGVDMTHEMLKKARQCRHYWRAQYPVSPRRARASAGGRQHRRRDPVQLRDQSGSG